MIVGEPPDIKSPPDFGRNQMAGRPAGKREFKVRLIKMFGLAALSAVAAMAFLGASSALASENTALCKVHQEPCAAGNLVTSIHMEASDSKLLAEFVVPVTVLCATALGEATVLGLGTAPNPQIAHITLLDWSGCETTTGVKCTVTTSALGLVNILKTALNLGTAESVGNEVNVNCGKVINCTYGGTPTLTIEGALHQTGTGHGMLTANALPVTSTGGTICPPSAKWDALFEPLEHTYIVG